MPQMTRHYCSRCKRSIYNTGVPLVVQLIIGQPEDTGEPFDLEAPTSKVPSFIREIMQLPIARLEFCVPCLADTFGLKVETPDSDPMFSPEQRDENASTYSAIRSKHEIDAVEKHAQLAARTLLAIKVGRGAEKPPKLPPKKAIDEPPRSPRLQPGEDFVMTPIPRSSGEA